MAAQSISSAYADSVALSEQNKFQKQQADFNAKLLDLKAEEAKRLGSEQADALKKKTAKLIGSQKVAAAASGVVSNFGSAQEAQQQTEDLASIDAEMIKNNANLEAWGFKVKKSELLLQSQMESQASEAKQRNTLLTGLSQGALYGYSASTGQKINNKKDLISSED